MIGDLPCRQRSGTASRVGVEQDRGRPEVTSREPAAPAQVAVGRVLAAAPPPGTPAVDSPGHDASGGDADELRRARETIADLQAALVSNRTIGAAVGILLERHKITAGEAFTRLVQASQTQNRKLRDVAADLVDTGQEI